MPQEGDTAAGRLLGGQVTRLGCCQSKEASYMNSVQRSSSQMVMSVHETKIQSGFCIAEGERLVDVRQ